MLSKTEAPMGPTFKGFIDTTHDALVLFEACKREQCTKITRRLQEKERSLITSGTVFVFDEKEAGIKRWTDGMLWSPSRILGNFLIYRELDKRPVEAAPVEGDAGGSVPAPILINSKANRSREKSLVGSLTASYRFKADGLVKKTISVSGMHMICYYRVSDVMQGRLRSPATVPELLAFEISPDLLINQNFRVPPKIEVGLDGQPRFASEIDTDSNNSSGAPRAAIVPPQYIPQPAAGPSLPSMPRNLLPNQYEYPPAPGSMYPQNYHPMYEDHDEHLHPADGLELPRGGSSGSAASDSSQLSQPPSPGLISDRRPRSQPANMRPQYVRTASSEMHSSRRYDPYARTSPVSPTASHAPWSSMQTGDYPTNMHANALAPPSWPPQNSDLSSVSPFAYNQPRLDLPTRPYSSGPSLEPFMRHSSVDVSPQDSQTRGRSHSVYNVSTDYRTENMQQDRQSYVGHAPMSSAGDQASANAHLYDYPAEREALGVPTSNQQLPASVTQLYRPMPRYSISLSTPAADDFRGNPSSAPEQTFMFDAGPLDRSHDPSLRHGPAPIDTSRPYSAAVSSSSSGPFYNTPVGFLSPSLAQPQPEQHHDYGRSQPQPAPYIPSGLVGPSGLPSPTEHFDERRRSSTMLPQQAYSAFPSRAERRWTYDPQQQDGMQEEVLSPYQHWAYRPGQS